MANLTASIALDYQQYNFVRVRPTLPCTSAMAAGVT